MNTSENYKKTEQNNDLFDLNDLSPTGADLAERFVLEWHINTAVRSFLTAMIEGLRIGDIQGGIRISREAVDSLEAILYGANMIGKNEEDYNEYKKEVELTAKKMYGIESEDAAGTEEERQNFRRAKLAVCIRYITQQSGTTRLSVRI